MPMVALDSVVDVLAMVVTLEEKSETVDFSHRITLPVLPARVKSAGAVPAQIVWSAEAVPPTEVGLTSNVSDWLKACWQFGVALVTVMPVMVNCFPSLAKVKAGVVNVALPLASAILPVAVCTGPPSMV